MVAVNRATHPNYNIPTHQAHGGLEPVQAPSLPQDLVGAMSNHLSPTPHHGAGLGPFEAPFLSWGQAAPHPPLHS